MAEHHHPHHRHQNQYQHQLETANQIASGILQTLWYICWPIGVSLYYVAVTIFSLLKLLYRPLGFLLQPLVYLGRFILACLAAPFHFLVRFEVSK